MRSVLDALADPAASSGECARFRGSCGGEGMYMNAKAYWHLPVPMSFGFIRGRMKNTTAFFFGRIIFSIFDHPQKVKPGAKPSGSKTIMPERTSR
jgi:hypothetical protein